MEENLDENKMPLLEHLTELRRRLLYSVLALLVSFLICFYFAGPIFNFLVQPLADLWAGQSGRRLIFTALHEKFLTEVKVAFFAGAFIAFPLMAAQFWIFVAPGLYRHEKHVFMPFLVATPILFFGGGAFVYYLVMPVAWNFFAGFEQAAHDGALAIQLEPKVNEYLALVMRLIFAFGISFELPVILSLLVQAGITSTQSLRKNRRYAILIAFVLAAILTPPDPLSQIGLAVPIILLYEVSILCAVLIDRRRRKARAKADAAAGVEPEPEDVENDDDETGR